ncbi:MAG: exopolysaccharide biosynthesis protein [Deltaproteobacteria bacterium]|nr:exopolysaccharide biosynthesis protein [Deltaproteobacteria bacterium]
MDVERARDTIAAEPPRRLRLDELLRELGAHDGEHTPPPRAAAITVGELVDRSAEAGFGFLVGVLTLIAIPFFGLSTPFGLAIALVGGQLAIGMARPWLPQRARRRELSMTMLDRVLGILQRRTQFLAKSTRRRWERLLMPRLVGLGIVLLGLGLALPLPIPGSNLIFLIPLFVYAVGLLERDGIWVLLGHLGTLVDMTLLVVFGATVLIALEHAWHWLF